MYLASTLSIVLTSKLGCRLAKFCAWGFALLALLFLLSLLSSWYKDLQFIFSKQSAEVLASQGASPSQISAAHLFGYHPTIELSAAPLSAVPLKLTGVIQSQSAKALISPEGEFAKIYQEGELLPGGLKLLLIAASEVLLDNHGHLERLTLQRNTLETKTYAE